jgi:hypothetical protein
MVKFNPDHKTVLDEMLLDDPRVRAGKMFGYPAYYAGEKLAICLYEDGVGVKLPAEIAARLIAEDENVVHFQPMGRRKMREWIQINLVDSAGYEHYRDVFDRSLDYVFSLSESKNAPGR